jgi:hypothetical protein
MRRHLSYANVAATLALVLAMSGGALAAGHYLINSTRQVNPKVLKKLRGPRGAKGEPGATGPQGPSGNQGTAGTNGANGKDGSLVATAFVQSSFSSPIALELTSKRVLTEKEGKTLKLTGPSAHVLVQATLQIAMNGPGGTEVTCRLAYEAVPGGTIKEFGEPSIQLLPPTSGEKSDELALTGNVTLLGETTYDLQVYCSAEGIGPTATVTSGALNAVAVVE